MEKKSSIYIVIDKRIHVFLFTKLGNVQNWFIYYIFSETKSLCYFTNICNMDFYKNVFIYFIFILKLNNFLAYY